MTEILRRWTVALTVSGVCFLGWADELPEGVTVVYPLYTVTTTGGTSSLSAVPISVVQEEGAAPVMKTIGEILPAGGGTVGGTFVKTGEGYLQSCDNMINFTGEIWVRQGALVVMGPGQLGPKDAGGDIHIADGASLGIDKSVSRTSQDMHIGNSMYLRGTGYEGRGVLYDDSPDDDMCACFHKGTFYFEDDATFGGTGGKWGDASDFKGYQLNGHTLTVASEGQYRTNGGKFYNGHVVVTGGGLNPQSNLTYSGGTSNSLTFCENSRWAGYHAAKFTFNSPWTLFLKDKVTFSFSGSLANAKKSWDSTTYDNWNGATVVDGLVTVANTSFTTNREAFSFIFNGPVSGPGGFEVTRGWLHFNNPTNTFTGPLSVAITGGAAYYGGLGFFDKDAFPAGNTCVVSNKNGGIYVTEAKTLIPAIDYETTGGTYTNAAIYGTGSVVTKSLVKRGVGELKLEAPVFVDGRTELLEGSIKLDPPRNGDLTQYSLAPGLYESMISFGTNEFPKGFVTAWYTNGENTPTNGVVSYPVLAEATGTSKGWSKHQTVRYQGYIWNRSAEPVTWSFATTFATEGQLLIDDQVVTAPGRKSNGSYAEWYYLRTNHVTLASGPHKFDFRAYNNGYAAGGAKDAYATWNDEKHESYGNFTDDGIPAWPSNFGLAYKEGEPSLYSTDYAIPQNGELTGREGGNGLLFTLDATPPEAHAAELARMTDENIRTADAWSSFTNLYANAGTAIDLQGSVYPLHLEAFEGSTCVSNGSVRLDGVWTLSPEAELPTAGAVLSVPQGKVTFGADAAIRLKDGKALRRLMRRTGGKLLDAGYVGSPTLLLDPEDPTFGCWKLRPEDDGLYLDYESGMVLIVK